MRIKTINSRISALFSALILMLIYTETQASLPLTETIYTIPDSQMTLSVREEFLELENYFRKDNFSLGLGIRPDISIWYSFDYLHNKIINASANTLGDSYFKIWVYTGDYLNIFHTGMLFLFRIPTGPNAYADEKWRNLSFGKNELKIGPVARASLKQSVFIHANIFYIFRQGRDEGFYNGFYLNLTKKETFSKLFGLNFKSKDTFFSGDRLKNDYAVFSTAINTNKIYPIIPYFEFYASHRVYKKAQGNENISIEGAGINPIFLSAGGRYFFSEAIFLGFYYMINPKREKKFIKSIIGLDFSLQF